MSVHPKKSSEFCRLIKNEYEKKNSGLQFFS